jgi:hypothetical protein
MSQGLNNSNFTAFQSNHTKFSSNHTKYTDGDLHANHAQQAAHDAMVAEQAELEQHHTLEVPHPVSDKRCYWDIYFDCPPPLSLSVPFSLRIK